MTEPIVVALAWEAKERQRSDDEQWRAIDRLADAYQSLSLWVQWQRRSRWFHLGATVVAAVSAVSVLLLELAR